MFQIRRFLPFAMLVGVSGLVAGCDTSLEVDDLDASMQKETDPFGRCGNGMVNEPAEQCDGLDLAGESCESLGYPQGALGCSSCLFDAGRCIGAERCGNGLVEDGEACEPERDNRCPYGETTCEVCTDDCTLVEGTPRYCGDGVREWREDEACDGVDLAGQSCVSFDFSGGALTCSDVCQMDLTGCEGPRCGDGVVEAPEECEPTRDNWRCDYDEPCEVCDRCRWVPGEYDYCGDGRLTTRWGHEECDGTRFSVSGCEELGLGQGELECDERCEIDASGCSEWSDASADVDDVDGTDPPPEDATPADGISEDGTAEDGTADMEGDSLTDGDAPERPADTSVAPEDAAVAGPQNSSAGGCSAGVAGSGWWLFGPFFGWLFAANRPDRTSRGDSRIEATR